MCILASDTIVSVLLDKYMFADASQYTKVLVVGDDGVFFVLGVLLIRLIVDVLVVVIVAVLVLAPGPPWPCPCVETVKSSLPIRPF